MIHAYLASANCDAGDITDMAWAPTTILMGNFLLFCFGF